MTSPVDCNQSLFSYNPNDYIDLKTVLTEEELSHSSNSRAHSREGGARGSYRYTLKSIDDTELDQFRRSLVTPLSANYKSQDPIYNNMTFSSQQYLNRRLNTRSVSPTNSFTTDTAESVALFNHLDNGKKISFYINLKQSQPKFVFLDEHKDVEDFVQTDLKDYMGSFNLDDLISRPGTTSTRRSPLLGNTRLVAFDLHFFYVFKTDNKLDDRHSPLLQKQQQYNDNINDATNLDNINKVTHKYNNTLSRKLSFDTSSSSANNLKRRLSSPAIQPVITNTREEDIPSSRSNLGGGRADSSSIKQEKLVKRLSLLTLKEKSTHSSTSSSQQSTIKRLQQQPAASNRRWSSYIPDQQKEEGGHFRSNSIRQSSAEQRSSLLLSSSRYKERRTSTTSTNDNNKQLPPVQQQRDLTSSSAKYVDGRRATSQRSSLLLEQQQQQRANAITTGRDITTSSRYAQRRESASSNNSNVDTRSKTLTAASSSAAANRYVDRRTSYRDPPAVSASTVANKRASYHAGVTSSGYGQQQQQQKSPSIRPTNTTATTANEKSNLLSTVQQQRRARALSVPSSANSNANAQYNDNTAEQPPKPSLMPVPVSRYRKTSNGSLSRYSNNTLENETTIPVAPPTTKEVRFSSVLIKKRNSTSGIEGVQLVASRSTGGFSNSTASSSHSSSAGEFDYDPPTPPSSYLEYEKRRSIPVYKEALPPQQVQQPRHKKYNSYLERLKDAYGVEEEEEGDQEDFSVPAAAPLPPIRRQRVVSEDNEHYYKRRQQQHTTGNQVANNARQVLAHLQEKRARTAAYLNK